MKSDPIKGILTSEEPFCWLGGSLWITVSSSGKSADKRKRRTHPAMLVVETLLERDKDGRPRRDPSRECRRLSEG